MSAWTIRPAAAADAAMLAGFWRDRYGETFAHLYPPADLAAFYAASYAIDRIAAEIAHADFSHHLAFDPEGRLLGAMKGGAVTLPLADAEGLWELHRLYLTKEAQGLGLADAFMALARAAALARGAQGMVLGVFSENERAKRFYARHGFVKIGEYKFVVGDTLDDEWIMRAPLQG